MTLNDLIASMAMELHDAETPAETADTIASYARLSVAADGAGLMVVRGGAVETIADTSDDIEAAHQLQAELGEGPCLAALEGGDATYLVRDTRADERWPRWGRAAADIGFHSVISSTLETSTRRIGSLNVYARGVDAFDDDDAAVISWLATHASVAIANVTEREGLRTALSHRTVIGQAEGLLMSSFGIDADQAFAYLKRLSQDTNTKLVKIAAEIIENTDQLGRHEPAL
ncbi:GAF and ANTAR domain-containing protein [Aeromicrobium terrae]|uniref:ANTAR domain-containing protein n=1 Tax=Aeromicrobium terrae TaxID=2498846 RepID=A0A5C8NMQ0_9ACTN|nr:GAF and ANTAR domain-containing protein [Aeromicrobium terrae]TXL62101.1 ANTAR domain-containing protein [Aeromicrobium terrae]